MNNYGGEVITEHENHIEGTEWGNQKLLAL